jgi:hypothetical protein
MTRKLLVCSETALCCLFDRIVAILYYLHMPCVSCLCVFSPLTVIHFFCCCSCLSGHAGIVGYKGGVVIANSMGSIWYLDLVSGVTSKLIDTKPSGDGLVLDGDRLYQNENANKRITVFDLAKGTGSNGTVTAKYVGYIASPLYDSPTTSALYGDGYYLYSVNGRFASLSFPATGEGDLSNFTEQFTMVRARTDNITYATN